MGSVPSRECDGMVIVLSVMLTGFGEADPEPEGTGPERVSKAMTSPTPTLQASPAIDPSVGPD
jgi:hypothetical protein